jgi:hypothetical protein
MNNTFAQRADSLKNKNDNLLERKTQNNKIRDQKGMLQKIAVTSRG